MQYVFVHVFREPDEHLCPQRWFGFAQPCTGLAQTLMPLLDFPDPFRDGRLEADMLHRHSVSD